MAADSISTEELQELLAAGQPVTVVDIREPTDREWSIPGSVQVDAYDAVNAGSLGPLASLEPRPGPVVTVCGMGKTASKATALLRDSGVEAVTLEGGMRAWSLAWNTAEATIAGLQIVQVRRTGKGCLSYLVGSGAEAVVIDASVDPAVYIRLLTERGWRLTAVVDTHIHADHLSRSKRLAESQGVPLWLPEQDRSVYPFQPVAEGDRIHLGSAELVALRTPGHTGESTTYVLEEAVAFTGDTLFMAGVGRPDLEGGANQESASRARLLYRSIQRLLKLPAEAMVLPGHVSEPIPFDGRLLATTIGEIRDNVALTRLTEAKFVEAVLARIPPSPPNHTRIAELNERGEIPEDPQELEAGGNRCAVA
jgi:glyoxylase-like metal-dependent hydrolase (beta-lactamase superfamily II)